MRASFSPNTDSSFENHRPILAELQLKRLEPVERATSMLEVAEAGDLGRQITAESWLPFQGPNRLRQRGCLD